MADPFDSPSTRVSATSAMVASALAEVNQLEGLDAELDNITNNSSRASRSSGRRSFPQRTSTRPVGDGFAVVTTSGRPSAMARPSGVRRPKHVQFEAALDSSPSVTVAAPGLDDAPQTPTRHSIILTFTPSRPADHPADACAEAPAGQPPNADLGGVRTTTRRNEAPIQKPSSTGTRTGKQEGIKPKGRHPAAVARRASPTVPPTTAKRPAPSGPPAAAVLRSQQRLAALASRRNGPAASNARRLPAREGGAETAAAGSQQRMEDQRVALEQQRKALKETIRDGRRQKQAAENDLDVGPETQAALAKSSSPTTTGGGAAPSWFLAAASAESARSHPPVVPPPSLCSRPASLPTAAEVDKENRVGTTSRPLAWTLDLGPKGCPGTTGSGGGAEVRRMAPTVGGSSFIVAGSKRSTASDKNLMHAEDSAVRRVVDAFRAFEPQRLPPVDLDRFLELQSCDRGLWTNKSRHEKCLIAEGILEGAGAL